MQKILLLALLAQSAGVGNKTIDASVHQKGANPLAFLVASSTPTTTIACNVADHALAASRIAASRITVASQYMLFCGIERVRIGRGGMKRTLRKVA
jgi:hypothetical protein